MRILLAFFALALLCLILPSVGATATVAPGSGYTWAQPGTALVSTPLAQPPAWVVAFATRPGLAPLTTYVWAQPGAAIATTPFAQPPASIPIDL